MNDSTEELDPEAALQLVHELLDAGDYRHAAFHLAAVAGSDPHELGFGEALERLCEAAEDPIALVPPEDHTYLGSVVLRGLVEARCGRLGDALVHLSQAERVDPTPGYLDAVSFDAASAAALQAVDVTRVGDALAELVLSTDDLPTSQSAEALRRVQIIVDGLIVFHPRCEPLMFAASMLLRRQHRYDKAAALARDFLEHTTCYRAAVALALACKGKGDYPAAVQAFELAQRLDPEHPAASLELGDMYGANGQLDEAIASYAAALVLAPQNAWALPSWHYYRWLSFDEPADARALAHLAEDPDNHRARDLHARVSAYETSVPPRPEALLKVVGSEQKAVQAAVSSLEAPSAVFVAKQLVPALQISMGPTNGVDPRLPRRKVKWLLWGYRSAGLWPFAKLTNDAKPLNAALVPATTNQLIELAHEPYSASAWYREAGKLAEALGPDATAACCAAMVAFTKAPDEYTLQDWTFRTQLAGAFVLSRMPDGEAILRDILDGPIDWVCTAAITALTQIAIEEPAHRERISRELLERIASAENPVGYMCIGLPAALNLLRIPGLPPEARKVARELRDTDEA